MMWPCAVHTCGPDIRKVTPLGTELNKLEEVTTPRKHEHTEILFDKVKY